MFLVIFLAIMKQPVCRDCRRSDCFRTWVQVNCTLPDTPESVTQELLVSLRLGSELSFPLAPKLTNQYVQGQQASSQIFQTFM